MTTSAVTFYSSSNGDRWQLITNVETGHKVVRHEPNLSSGGRTSEIGVPEFLSRSGASPQAAALQAVLHKRGESDAEDE